MLQFLLWRAKCTKSFVTGRRALTSLKCEGLALLLLAAWAPSWGHHALFLLWLCLSIYPFPLIRIPYSSFTPPLCQDYLYTFLPWWDPSAYCSTFFLYLALPSLLFPIFPPHTVLILCFVVFFPMLFSHAAPSFAFIIICLERKSWRTSTYQHGKGSTHSLFSLIFFIPLCASDFLPKLLATRVGIVPDVLKLSDLALRSYWDRNAFSAEHNVSATQYIWFWDACEMCSLKGLDHSTS